MTDGVNRMTTHRLTSEEREERMVKCARTGCGLDRVDPDCWHPGVGYALGGETEDPEGVRPLTAWLRARHYAAGVPASAHIIRVTHRPTFDIRDLATLDDCPCDEPEHDGHEYHAACEQCSYSVIGSTMAAVLRRADRDQARGRFPPPVGGGAI